MTRDKPQPPPPSRDAERARGSRLVEERRRCLRPTRDEIALLEAGLTLRS